MATKTMLRVKNDPDGDEPKVKRRANGNFKAIIDIEDYNPELVASYATKIKIKKNRKVKLKGKIRPGQTILKPNYDEPVQTTIL